MQVLPHLPPPRLATCIMSLQPDCANRHATLCSQEQDSLLLHACRQQHFSQNLKLLPPSTAKISRSQARCRRRSRRHRSSRLRHRVAQCRRHVPLPPPVFPVAAAVCHSAAAAWHSAAPDFSMLRIAACRLLAYLLRSGTVPRGGKTGGDCGGGDAPVACQPQLTCLLGTLTHNQNLTVKAL